MHHLKVSGKDLVGRINAFEYLRLTASEVFSSSSCEVNSDTEHFFTAYLGKGLSW